ncbi:MAG: histidinol dehydrogenase [Actinomycetota bacterium]|nr:histidinol dehydrogenase [Actinomycetota bacterium]
MLERLDLRGVTGDLSVRLPRPSMGGEEPLAAVRQILADVEHRGDDAVRELTSRFDGVDLDELRVPPDQVKAASNAIDPELLAALEAAADRIEEFHRTQLVDDHDWDGDGIVVRGLHRAVRRAGLYVPGGRAAYPSTVLMTAIPARVAGVSELALCVPPDRTIGAIPAVTLAAAAVAGVDEVYQIGGAQAVAAMAYGTASVPAVDVIAGPGNVYVAVAKREVAGRVGVPMSFAGPSEVVVVADATVPADFAAIDVILQAEHGPDGLAWLVTWDPDVADAVTAAVERLVDESPRREDILSTLDEGGYAVVCDGPAQAMEVCNLIAPEHLELMVADPEALVPLVENAGAVFTGVNGPASIGDYLAGPSHVLPTFGTARFASALTVTDFQKQLHVISVSPEGLDRVGPHVAALADAEGLDAHAQSIRMRQAPR